MLFMADEEEDPQPQLPPPTPGFYMRHRNQGFAAHITASAANLSSVRELTAKVLTEYGVDAEVAETAQLVVSELAGNSVRACGDHVPIVVEVYATAFGVSVNVHDPEPGRLPSRGLTALDDAEAESGRGLALLELFAPGWQIHRSAIGKQIRCYLGR